MDLQLYACSRLKAVRGQIAVLLQSEFPYKDSEDALKLIDKRFAHMLGIIEGLDDMSKPSAINYCSGSILLCFENLPLLGFLLRSTNVRNAFESYFPLLRLAQRVLDEKIKLVISSEWEYSPLLYYRIKLLPGYVLIGFPASESENPLLIPLAGHEFGHCAWGNHNMDGVLRPKAEVAIRQELLDHRLDEFSALYSNLYRKEDITRLAGTPGLFGAVPELRYACDLAIKQAEEVFCDFFGLRLFAESYLYAHALLIAPKTGVGRSLAYPNVELRVKYLTRAATAFGVTVPQEYEEVFEDDSVRPDKAAMLYVVLADSGSTALVDDLIISVQKFISSDMAPMRDSDVVKEISECFRNMVPAPNPVSLADITNSAWVCYLEKDLWKEGYRNLAADRKKRDRVFRDLVLKTVQVLEIAQRLGDNHASER